MHETCLLAWNEAFLRIKDYLATSGCCLTVQFLTQLLVTSHYLLDLTLVVSVLIFWLRHRACVSLIDIGCYMAHILRHSRHRVVARLGDQVLGRPLPTVVLSHDIDK